MPWPMYPEQLNECKLRFQLEASVNRAIYLIGAAVALIFVGGFIWKPPGTPGSSDVAGWVQAVGSMAAIGVTFLVWRMDKVSAKNSAMALFRKTAAVIELDVHQAVEFAGKNLMNRRKDTESRLEEELRVLRAIDIGIIDETSAVDLFSLTADLQLFFNEFQYQNQSNMFAQQVAFDTLNPMKEAICLKTKIINGTV